MKSNDSLWQFVCFKAKIVCKDGLSYQKMVMGQFKIKFREMMHGNEVKMKGKCLGNYVTRHEKTQTDMNKLWGYSVKKMKPNIIFDHLLLLMYFFHSIFSYFTQNAVNFGGTTPPTQKLACYVLYLKIINTFLKMIYASYSKLSKELKNSIKN